MINKIYLAGGCFWGLQAYFSKIKGIIKTTVGYVNGNTNDTNYQNIKNTDHAEAVEIEYNDNIINIAEILDRFMLLIDPYSLNRQGNDIGRQYRTGIYYLNDYDRKCANLTIKIYEKNHNNKKTVIEIQKLANFIKAEDYHQNYLDKNPNGYCHINLDILNQPLAKFNKINNDEIQKLNLDELILNIMLNKNTEKPFSSILNENTQSGIYVDIISKEPLFLSEDKYDAGCGWPSFTKPIMTDSIKYELDNSHYMNRIEALSNIQNSHLGHVFNDGPKNKGSLRYCINGATLKFISIKNLENSIYEKYLPYFKEIVNNQK
ncbi:peptide-methionine (R)-S-oxide reductase [Metamycoplasma phocicerebrale]|uniref:Peptide methionine sulfoxide reductase MsrA n=1 Tax=Metamycoplasma phocicerebrale TaxID=142649 RepID=A0A3Q9V5G2_9BACT|nr:peptide-methionine (R)-S-oxide reductase MsrB [Metamycoplasma phocicerebrale]AZZ65530.1 peptide-methionine (R)-S-oxide reductase [Metamycoplasma phocicerebrale]